VRAPPSWRSLTPGLLALAGLVGTTVAILLFAQVGGLHGATMRLYVSTDDATGVIRGTDVWHSGERIGAVDGTSLRPVRVDTSQRVLVAIEILKDLAPRIRRDTRAQIRPGTSMLGAPVVYLSGGSPSSPPVRDGDTIAAQPQSALDETRAAFARGEDQIPALRADVESLTSQLFSHTGTIGAVNTRTTDNPRVTVLDALTSDLRRRSRAAKPAVALDSLRDVFNTHAAHALAAADSLRRFLALPGGTLERLEQDTAFTRSVRDTRSELDSLQQLLATPSGTMGRLHADSALRHRLGEADKTLDELSRDAALNPSRYLPF
jgi:phospholipid/cholesterol/gamma-HCH transport system substrate-binding protein